MFFNALSIELILFCLQVPFEEAYCVISVSGLEIPERRL